MKYLSTSWTIFIISLATNIRYYENIQYTIYRIYTAAVSEGARIILYETEKRGEYVAKVSRPNASAIQKKLRKSKIACSCRMISGTFLNFNVQNYLKRGKRVVFK